MKKICLALVGSAIILAATPVVAGTVIVAGPYKNHGDCSSALSFARWADRKGYNNPINNADGEVSCQYISGAWFVVVG
jgi:hypothetical protein